MPDFANIKVNYAFIRLQSCAANMKMKAELERGLVMTLLEVKMSFVDLHFGIKMNKKNLMGLSYLNVFLVKNPEWNVKFLSFHMP